MRSRWFIPFMLAGALTGLAEDFPATRVTLRLDNVPIDQALKIISDSTGNPTLLAKNNPPKALDVSIHAEDQPYWNVIHDLCVRYKLSLATYSPNAEIFNSDVNARMPFCISNGTLFMIHNQPPRRATDPAKEDAGEPYSVSVAFHPEPKYCNELYLFLLICDKIEADDGSPIDLVDAVHAPVYRYAPPCQVRSIRFKPQSRISSLKTLAGRLVTLQETEFETWTIDDFAKAQGQSKTLPTGEMVTIQSIVVTDQLFDSPIPALLLPNQERPEPIRVRQVDFTVQVVQPLNAFCLLDASRFQDCLKTDKPDITPNMSRMSVQANQSSRILTLSYVCWPKKGGENPTKLMISLPSRVSKKEVPFEFHNIEVP